MPVCMARYGITISDQAIEAFQSVLLKLKMDYERGVGFAFWQPTQSKTVEFLVWIYKKMLEKGSVTIHDLVEFRPVTAIQGRVKQVPTDHQFSVAAKMLTAKLQREPTHDEVLTFLKRNPDVGKWEFPS